MMDLKFVSQLRLWDFCSKPSAFPFNCVEGSERVCKCRVHSDGFSGLSARRTIPSAEFFRAVDHKESSAVSGRFNKDFSSFSRPISISGFNTIPDDSVKVRVSIKGAPGSYSEDAALKAYPKCEIVHCDDFEDAFKAVELSVADKAVLPIESSAGGSIHQNYDLLLCHKLSIVGEVQLPVNLCLLALPGVRAEELKRVLSHPQALAFSNTLLSKLGVAGEDHIDDTAGAAQYVASNGLRNAGVIASARTAEIYGLNILRGRIQDYSDIIVRYVVLARDRIIPSTDKPFKTSIVFTLNDGPRALFKALGVLALRGINLAKIESRPQRSKHALRAVDDSVPGSAKRFEYLYYVDFEASMAESRVQNALGQLQEFVTFLRVLGCYPMDMTP